VIILHVSIACDVTTEIQGREERSKQYFDTVLNGIGASEADELLNNVCSCFASCNILHIVV